MEFLFPFTLNFTPNFTPNNFLSYYILFGIGLEQGF